MIYITSQVEYSIYIILVKYIQSISFKDITHAKQLKMRSEVT